MGKGRKPLSSGEDAEAHIEELRHALEAVLKAHEERLEAAGLTGLDISGVVSFALARCAAAELALVSLGDEERTRRGVLVFSGMVESAAVFICPQVRAMGCAGSA